jgi:hypothetical protein
MSTMTNAHDHSDELRDDTGPQDLKTVHILRRGIGIVGLLLPPAVTVGCLLREGEWPGSMSATYYTGSRDLFVGGLWAIGVFLISYRPEAATPGRRFWKSENFWSTLAGALAILVSLFPTLPDQTVVKATETERQIAMVHGISAVSLFVILALFCYFIFPRLSPGKQLTPRKVRRNKVYRTCGRVIVAAVVIALLASFLPTDLYARWNPLLWCEAAAVWAFAVGWFVKGETILTDGRTAEIPPGGAI